ncbi:MAG: flagellar hook-basal body complex protein FliE [Bdellovibrionaceae bacterium]|jgi:flagellar hook-basal body complex protein FliE|nr:flagellar hook-basal body complex protein FliE [Pseudobdellovibrionaceae bacterium]
MAGFTVSSANNFLDTGAIRDSKSLTIEQPLSSGSSQSVGAAGKSFADTLKGAIENVNQLQKASDKSAQDLATGRTDNVADVMIAAEKADIALRVMVQMRNKIIDAYQEIMKMQV